MSQQDVALAKMKLQQAANRAGTRLQQLWNAETKRYENAEEVAVLHGMINDLVSANMAIRRIEREMETQHE